jgi:CheY-like chemotaxis protein
MKPVNLFPSRIKRSAGGRPRVLLVDDDRRRRYAVAELLRSDGCEVHTSSGHESWLALFKTCLSEPATWVSFVAAIDPDVLMLDIEQPMALTTIGALRRHPLTDHIPVVVLGEEAQQRYLNAALALGAVRQLHRPLALSGLRPLVDSVLSEAPPRKARTGDETPLLEVN